MRSPGGKRARLLLTGGVVAFGLLVLLPLFFYKTPADSSLKRFTAGCAGCHVRVTLHLDGIVASRFSKGVHPVNQAKLRSPRGWLRSRECLPCHAREHREWSSSAHGRSLTNTLFRTALKRDRKDWCINCHAPLWEPARDKREEIIESPRPGAAYSEGVNCAVCHVRDGRIYGVRKRSPRQAFHPVYADPKMGTERFCAGCHQFNFVAAVEPVVQYENGPAMQNTIGEHRATVWHRRGQHCQSCHFKNGDHSLHQTRSGRDMRDSLAVHFSTDKATAANETGKRTASPKTAPKPRTAARYRVRATVTIPKLGHAFPTGDLFRIYSIYVYDRRGREMLRYDFRKEVRVVDRHLIRDGTLRPDAAGRARRTVQLEVPRFPARCLATYRLQGGVEPELIHRLPLHVLRRDTYDGPCDGGTNPGPNPGATASNIRS